ncbi:MAG: Na+/H+ antiporter subunit E [Candidatus Cloacimonadales bacterium]
MKIFKQSAMAFISLMIFWILLAGTQVQELIVGAVISLLLALIFQRSSRLFGEFRLSFKSVIYFIRYIFVFLYELIKSNLDVAFRVVHPSLPINPGIVRVKTKLKSRLGRVMLANSITLTPGTLTVETDGEDFYIHWIDVSASDIDTATEKIVHKFEKYLEVFYG